MPSKNHPLTWLAISAALAGAVLIWLLAQGPDEEASASGVAQKQSEGLLSLPPKSSGQQGSVADKDQPTEASAQAGPSSASMAKPQAGASEPDEQPGRAQGILETYRQRDQLADSDHQTVSEEVEQRIKPALDRLTVALRESERSRAIIDENYETNGFRYLMAKIPPLPAAQLARLEAMIEEQVKDLPEYESHFFRVDAQRLLDAFTAAKDKTLVVYVTENTDLNHETAGNFASYITDRPDDYQPTENGKPLRRPLRNTPYKMGLLFRNDGTLEPRFLHFVSRTR